MRILPARTRRMRRLSASALAVAALVAGMFGFTPTAGATVALSVTATSVTLAAPNSTVGLPGLNVTGAQPTDQLQVTVATSVGTLSITTISGLTLSYNNHWTGDASITFTGAQADIDAALASVSLVSGNNAGQTASISLTAMIAQSGYVYLAPNQHFYQYVASSDITWTAADAAAKAATFNGQRGYLATIPNDTVNNFITSKIQGALSVWFGAYAYPNENGYGRVWRWTKGTDESPLQGQVISNCASNAANTTCSFSNNAGLYSHWASGEPNNYNGGENVPVTNWGAANGNWNDLAPNATGIAGYVIEYGDQSTGSTGFTGVVNTASNVLIATVPGTPTGVSAARGNGSATVTFTAPAGNGSPITSYTITPSAGSPVSCAASPCLVGGLTNGTSYQFKVHATNGIGDGADSAWTSPVTPATVPGAPTGVSADRGNTSATVSFAAPAFDGGSAVTSYTVTSAPGGITNTCAGSPCVVTGLTNGTAYQFEVHATNSVGNGAESAWTSQVTPATVPGASTGVTATRGDGSATVTFTPGGNGGSAITGYIVTVSPGGATAPCDSSPCLVGGLANGTSYTFGVQAVNDVGAGASAGSNAVTPGGAPFAPGSFTATRGDGAVTVSFVAPDDNGAEITGYQVSTDGGATWNLLTTTGTGPLSGTVSGLVNGQSYDVEVRALNDVGPGGSAGPQQATPATLPGAPGQVSGLRGDGQATISWEAADDNGSPVTAYTVTASPGGRTVGCAASPCVVDGLTNGQPYTFTVSATNDVGDGGASEPSDAVTPATVPGAPTDLRVERDDSALHVSFHPPADNGGDPVVGYEVSTDGGRTWQPLTTSDADPIAGTVSGLHNGSEYRVQVRAVNTVGAGAASGHVDGFPATVPDAPSGLHVRSANGALDVSFTAPAGDGGDAVTGYEASTDGITWHPLATSGTDPVTGTVSGLDNGTSYRVRVRAVNTVGAGSASETVTSTPATVPGPPRQVTAAVSGARVTVAWKPPADDGGARITGYVATAQPGGATCRTRGATHCTFARLSTGRHYTFSVRAVNSAPAAGVGTGTGSSSTRSHPVVPATAPGVPTRLHVTTGDRVLRLRFNAPATGGASITRYEISTDGGRTWHRLKTVGRSVRDATVAGVINGHRYGVTVRAVNRVGTGHGAKAVAARPRLWFTDPVGAGARHREIAVPANPTRYRGPLARTTADGRSYYGTPAYSAAALHGHQLQPGQAVSLGGRFDFDSPVLSPTTRAHLRAVAASLRYVHVVTCEGFADYGGLLRHENEVSTQRAVNVCRALRAVGVKVAYKIGGYGPTRPVVVGGTHADRADNRRVVIVVIR